MPWNEPLENEGYFYPKMVHNSCNLCLDVATFFLQHPKFCKQSGTLSSATGFISIFLEELAA